MEMLGNSVMDSIECYPAAFGKREPSSYDRGVKPKENCIMSSYGENEAAKLDAVLDSVNQLIESLNLELDKVPTVTSSETGDVSSELVIGGWSGKPTRRFPVLSAEAGASKHTENSNSIKPKTIAHADNRVADVSLGLAKQNDESVRKSRGCGVFNELSEVAEAYARSPFGSDVIVFTKTDNHKSEEPIKMEYELSKDDKSSQNASESSFTPHESRADSKVLKDDFSPLAQSSPVISKSEYMRKQHSEPKIKSFSNVDKQASLAKKGKRGFSLGSFFSSSLSGNSDPKTKSPDQKQLQKISSKFVTKPKDAQTPPLQRSRRSNTQQSVDESWLCFQSKENEDLSKYTPKKSFLSKKLTFRRALSLEENNNANTGKLVPLSPYSETVDPKNYNNPTVRRMRYHMLKSNRMNDYDSRLKENLFLGKEMEGSYMFYNHNETSMLVNNTMNGGTRHSAADLFNEQSVPAFTARRATMDSVKSSKRKGRSSDGNLSRQLWTRSMDKYDNANLENGLCARHSLSEVGKSSSFPVKQAWESGSDESVNEHPKAKYGAGIQRHFSDRVVRFNQSEDGAGEMERQTKLNAVKNKFRKSLKNQIPVLDADELAERTWLPNGECTWSNMSGRKMVLGSTKLHSLSELECEALKKVALQKLHDIDLGVTIVSPKDESKIPNRKISMKKKYAVHLSARDKNKEKSQDHVFGIPLINVVENDQLLRLQKSASFATSLDVLTTQNQGPDTYHGSSSSSNISSSTGSLASINVPKEVVVETKEVQSENCSETNKAKDNVFSNEPQQHSPTNQPRTPDTRTAKPLKRRGAIAADSLNDIDPYQSQLLEALSLSVSGATQNQRKEKKRSLLPPTMLQVPYVVQKCCDHITKYGLDVTGIFRLAGSKKRARQLREEFDQGVDVTIDEDYNPHDVAALLKEFFRDLPEALLTRELYPAFIQVTKLRKSERIPALRLLVWLLPASNRDTLQTLLNFLSIVASRAEDSADQLGNKVEGNKMSVGNLATIFGPNILHRYKKSQSVPDNQYQVQSLDKAEDSSAVITVVEEMILNQSQLFQIPKKEHDHMLRILKESDPEAVDFLLRRKAANHMREKSKLLTKQLSIPKHLGNGFIEATNMNSNNNSTSQTPDSNDEAVDFSEINITQLQPLAAAPAQTLRKSYQQATGAHNNLTGNAAQKSDKLKFKRPNIKRAVHLNNYSDLEEQSEGANSGNNSEIEVRKEKETFTRQADVRVEPLKDNNRISTSSIFSMPPQSDRTMSFTEDDIQDILSPNGGSPLHENVKTGPVVHTERPASCDERRDSKEIFSGAQSSDSGISVESTTPTIVTSPSMTDSPGLNRRGGFSIRQMEESKKSNESNISSELNRALARDIKCLDKEQNEDEESVVENHQQYYTSRIKMQFNPNTNHSNSTTRPRRSSQIIRLCRTENITKLKNDPIPEDLSSDTEDTEIAEEKFVRKRLPSSLSPRVQRHYFAKGSKLPLKAMINTNKQSLNPKDLQNNRLSDEHKDRAYSNTLTPLNDTISDLTGQPSNRWASAGLEPKIAVVKQRHARHTTKHTNIDKTKSPAKGKIDTFSYWYNDNQLPETSV